MSDTIQIPVSDQAASVGLNVSKILLAVLVLVIIGVGAYAVLTWQKKNAENEAIARSAWRAEVFAPKGYENYISVVDNELATKKLSEDTRNMLLFKKAIVMIDAVEPDEKAKEQLSIQAGSIFRSLFETTSDTESGKRMRAYGVLGHLLDFNQRFFLNSNTLLLPAAYSSSYAALYKEWTAKEKVVLRTEFQKLAFQSHLKLAYDPAAEIIARDKTFLSNRMYLTAVYLASFYREMTSEEKEALFAQLKQDIEMYPNSLNIAFTDDRHTKLVADFYYAYASSVYAYAYASGAYADLVGPLDLDNELKMVAERYENARKNVKTEGDFAVTNTTMGTYIDTYYLVFLSMSKPEGYEAKMDELVKEMNAYAENEDTKAIITSYYDNFLNVSGSWMGIRKILVSLSKTDKEYAAYLDNLGVAFK